jgi:hypothetical protein
VKTLRLRGRHLSSVDRAATIAVTIVRDLKRAHDIAGFDIALTADIARILSLASEIAIDVAGFDIDVGQNIDTARRRTRDLEIALTAHRLDVSHALALALGARHLSRRHAVCYTLDIARRHTYTLDQCLSAATGSARDGQGQRSAVRMAPLAGRLLAVAAGLLPAGDRARYAEEFLSELTEMAQAGARRRQQLVYAARVALSARRLRADLRAPRRRGAAP